jgi:hypothetical protein
LASLDIKDEKPSKNDYKPVIHSPSGKKNRKVIGGNKRESKK